MGLIEIPNVYNSDMAVSAAGRGGLVALPSREGLTQIQLADVRHARVRKAAPLQVGDETLQQVIVRRGHDHDHVAQLNRVN
jgi:hypothetical protein